MKDTKKLCEILSILYFILFLIFSYFVFSWLFTASIGLRVDLNYDMSIKRLLSIRRFIAGIFSLVFCLVIDFSFVDMILIKIRKEKYSNILFKCLAVFGVIFIVLLFIFFQLYPLY